MGGTFGEFIIIQTATKAKIVESEELYFRERLAEVDWMTGRRTVDALNLQWSTLQIRKFANDKFPDLPERR